MYTRSSYARRRGREIPAAGISLTLVVFPKKILMMPENVFVRILTTVRIYGLMVTRGCNLIITRHTLSPPYDMVVILRERVCVYYYYYITYVRRAAARCVQRHLYVEATKKLESGDIVLFNDCTLHFIDNITYIL